jgi:hypothetical protein
MVEFAEVVLNVGGWLVAATVTLFGIFLLHLWEQWSRERREVYSPLHREVLAILDSYRADSLRQGNVQPLGDEFLGVHTGGLLHLRRHDKLRTDVDLLIRLRDEADESGNSFTGAAHDALKRLYSEAGLESYDGQLVSYLVMENVEAWHQHVGRLPEDQTEALLGTDLTAENLYGKAEQMVRETRSDHLRRADALLTHAETVRVHLEGAMRSFRGRYKRPRRQRG